MGITPLKIRCSTLGRTPSKIRIGGTATGMTAVVMPKPIRASATTPM
jgi:hypothetical protein